MYEATNADGARAAVKIYDAQFADAGRLKRELTLAGHDCPHLVQVLGGGSESVEGTEFLFLLMEFVEGRELTKVRDRSTPTPDTEIRRMLRQLCVACQYLLERDLCHRDIKPQNIKLRDNGDVVLLDMGVLRPTGDSDLTQEGRNIATRRYSPPELQHRLEQADPLGLEAITVYQVGAVLYELIQRTKLFANVPDQPDATLSRAVDAEIPRFVGATAGADLCELALRCLAKTWKDRPRLSEVVEVAAFESRETDSIIARRRQQGREGAAEIRSAESQTETHLTSLEESRKAAASAVLQALCVPELPAPAREQVPGRRNGSLVVASFPQSIEHGFPSRLMLVVDVVSRRSDGAILVKGLGLYGSSSMPQPKQAPQIFWHPVQSARPKWDPKIEGILEELWSLPLDAETLSRKVSEWAKRVVETYLARTEETFLKQVEFQKAASEAKRTGGHHKISPPNLRLTAFNTKEEVMLRSRSWVRVT